MAYLASKKIGYWRQLGILLAFVGGGLMIGGLISILPLLSKMSLVDITNMDKVMVPANANLIRIMQFISTLFLFFIPAVLYAKICHVKPFTHLGFKKQVTLQQAGVVILIMFVALFVSGFLGDVTKMIPFPKEWMARFNAAEDAYKKQVEVIGRMNNVQDYLISLFMLAILPAVFEETLFRGGIQNLLERWFKKPLLAIIVTSLLFSAMHGSYLGFLSRAALGFILGWMYHRTGNLWLSIIGHVVNNAVGVTALFYLSKKGMDTDKADVHIPIWAGLITIAIIVALFKVFDNVSKQQIDEPGKEKPIIAEENNIPGWMQS